MDKKEGKIICGFAGIGKSYAGRTIPNFIDLESTPFNKDFKTYVKVANHMRNQGYIVMVSCHAGLRAELLSQNIPYTLIVPDVSCKDEYLERYANRGNTEDFIKLQRDNWENFTKPLSEEYGNTTIITLHSGEYLKDVMNNILS